MPLTGTCPACGRKLQIADKLAGRPVRCPGCQAVIRLGSTPPPARSAPRPAAPPPPPPPAPEYDELEVVEDEGGEELEVLPADEPAAPRAPVRMPRLLQARKLRITCDGGAEYVLPDAETDKELGVAVVQGGQATQSCTVAVHDARSDEELFAAHRGPFRKFIGFDPVSVEFTTPDDALIGSFETMLIPSEGAFWVRDANGRKFAEVDGQWHPRPDYVFLGRDGGKLGRVRHEGERRRLFTSPFGWCKWGGELVLSLAEALADDPEGKMRLLGTALMLEISVAGLRINAGPMR